MHIPRQADRSGAARPAQIDVVTPDVVTADAVATDGPIPPGLGTEALGADALRARRRHLVSQLRAVGYWQRLVRARTDLVVAGLLYSAPVATGVPAWAPAAPGPCADTSADALDLHGMATPPEGLDVARLLDGLGGCSSGDGGPGAQLDRLRVKAVLLAGHSRALQEELDVVTLALHDRLAADGADDAPLPQATPLSR